MLALPLNQARLFLFCRCPETALVSPLLCFGKQRGTASYRAELPNRSELSKGNPPLNPRYTDNSGARISQSAWPFPRRHASIVS